MGGVLKFVFEHNITTWQPQIMNNQKHKKAKYYCIVKIIIDMKSETLKLHYFLEIVGWPSFLLSYTKIQSIIFCSFLISFYYYYFTIFTKDFEALICIWIQIYTYECVYFCFFLFVFNSSLCIQIKISKNRIK